MQLGPPASLPPHLLGGAGMAAGFPGAPPDPLAFLGRAPRKARTGAAGIKALRCFQQRRSRARLSPGGAARPQRTEIAESPEGSGSPHKRLACHWPALPSHQ